MTNPQTHIMVRGAREHNLKNIDLDIPKHALVVFTGLSGSGKSSLAFDTIYAEGQRRYIESLSSYARQFLGQSGKPDVDVIEGLSPAISIDQKSASHNPRSTVGTVTEINDYLRLLYARIGLPHCPNDGKPIRSTTVDEIVDRVLAISTAPRLVTILAPIVRGRKGEYHQLLQDLYADGFTTVQINGQSVALAEQMPKLARYKAHTISLVIDQLTLTDTTVTRLTEAIELAAERADGIVQLEDESGLHEFNLRLSCSACGTSVPELEPRSFSFNSPFGACPTCDGLGVQRNIDPALVIPDDSKTIADGGILPWTYSPKNWYGFTLRAVAEHYRIDMKTPLKNLQSHQRALLLRGPAQPVRIPAVYYTQGKRNIFHIRFEGIIPLLERRWRETESEAVREDLGKYMAESPCPDCDGTRLKPETLLVTVGDRNIAQLSQLPVDEALTFVQSLTLTPREGLIGRRILKEITDRLRFLQDVGLGYLTLSRSATTLAGGEAQRIRLASQVGSRLTGVLYVLDEPSIGLHPRDNEKLIAVLKELRDLGNTVLVVEHDDETIRAANYVVDIGPGAGKHGGAIMAQGTPDEVAHVATSITGQYLAGTREIPVPARRRKGKQLLSVRGATANNLKRLTAHFPLSTFTCVTGVSGSGKSTLVTDVLHSALARKLHRALVKPGAHERIEGGDHIRRVVLISQSPIGRTPRSNPATYTGVFTPIRELFAATRDAKERGYTPGRFSFNVPGGRCEHCKGDGLIRIEMQFLPDVYIPCDVCHGQRYSRETLAVHFADRTIADILAMSVDEALEFFKDFPGLADKLQIITDVGLGYIELGQSATTLSG
ncbi:excinuclease ABC subunit UvrA, partial [Candidatus Berkelbacteria bacterium]|nr:excinuclease ABC subunit UvrA [Candidatus Berkelbacteria bacterium]